MRVKLCSRCPYAPRDLADHYDPDAALYACARCDSELEVLNPSGPCEARRRRQCSTGLDITSTITPSVAPFATESWPHPSLLLADCRLFEKMPRSIQGPQGERHRMAVPISRRLTTVSIAAA